MVFFSGGKGGGEMVDYGYKGKGMTTHLLVEGNGNPLCFGVTSAKGDERQQVEKLLIPLDEKIRKIYEVYRRIPILEADKGYDANELRYKLLNKGVFPLILYRRIGAAKKAAEIICGIKKLRWKVERAIAWLQRKFRRLVVRWERKVKYWKGFLNFSLIYFWTERLSG